MSDHGIISMRNRLHKLLLCGNTSREEVYSCVCVHYKFFVVGCGKSCGGCDIRSHKQKVSVIAEKENWQGTRPLAFFLCFGLLLCILCLYTETYISIIIIHLIWEFVKIVVKKDLRRSVLKNENSLLTNGSVIIAKQDV